MSVVGRIKSFNFHSGYGFIVDASGCQEDVFVSKDQIPLEWQITQCRIEDLEVRFDLTVSKEGKHQARNLKLANAPEQGNVVAGVVKSWNANKGFGFLRVDGLNSDVFFARDRLPTDLRQINRMDGVTMGFELTKAPDGKWQAQNMYSFGAAQMGMTQLHVPLGNLGLSTVAVPQTAFRGQKRPLMTTEINPAKRQQLEGKRLIGQVKSYNSKNQNSYGFIIASQVPDDIVFYAKETTCDPHPGDHVQFDLRYSPGGRPQAHNVAIVETPGMNPEVQTNGGYPPLTVDDLKLYTAQLNTQDLGELAAYATQLLQSKLGQ